MHRQWSASHWDANVSVWRILLFACAAVLGGCMGRILVSHGRCACWTKGESMSEGMSVIRMVCVPAIVLTFVLITSTLGFSQPASQSREIEGFFESLIGDWVGTLSQSTDGKPADTKYFHAATKQLSLDTYETVFTYYRLDKKSGAPVLAGVSGMATKIDSAGTATNSVTGKGDILIDVNTLKPEMHELTEVLSASPTGGLQGTGSGSISVSGMPLGLGKNGKVLGYSSTWSVSSGVLRISQRLKVRFSAFLFSKSFTVAADYTATRGTDILGLIKGVPGQGPGH